MAIKLGTTDINKVYLGATQVNKVYLGATVIVGNTVPIEDKFIITVKTDNTGTSTDTQFSLPAYGTSYDVDWGDGNTSVGLTILETHTYSVAGTYDISISGALTNMSFYLSGDENKLLDIKQWGNISWTTFASAFRTCTSLTTITATDIPNLSGVVSLDRMFASCSNLVSVNLVGWDTSTITNTGLMFYLDTKLEVADVSNWNVSSFSSMDFMLYALDSLWDYSLANWDISSIPNAANLMSSTSMSTANYDATLISWAAQTPPSGRTFDFGNSTYTLGGAAAAAKSTLETTYTWTITDGGGIVAPPVVQSWTSAWVESITETSITVDKPAGVESGDLILLVVSNDVDERDTFPQFDDVTKPTGFTLSNTIGNDTIDATIATYYKIADGGEGANFTLTGLAARFGMTALALRITGVNATTPIGVIGASTDHLVFPATNAGITTINDNSLALTLLAGDGSDTAPFTVSTNGWAEGGTAVQDPKDSGSTALLWAYKEMPTAGATGSINIATGGPTNVEGSISFSFSINPI